jgi:integrase
MKNTLKFTDAALSKLKRPTDRKQTVIADPLRTGASFRLQESGVASFIFSKRQNDGTRFNATLGRFGEMSVEEARDKAREFSRRIRNGEDLRAAARAEKAIAKAVGGKGSTREPSPAAPPTFTLRMMIRKWDHEHLTTRRTSYAKRAERDVSRALADLVDREASTITKVEIRERVDRATTRGTRRFLASVIVAMFNYALKYDWIAVNPVAKFPMPEVLQPRTRTISISEARIIYAAMGALEYPERQFLRLLQLSACRREEIGGLRWDEIQEDEEGPILLIPAWRTKTGRISQTDHRVPLTPEMLRAIAEARDRHVVGCPFVFTRDGRLSLVHYDRIKERLDREVKKIADFPPFKLHDFRRSAITALASKGHDPIALDRLLGHVPRVLQGMVGVYNRYEHAAPRRRALEEWAELIAAPLPTGNVRKLKRAR